jgi:Tfp pilus assembly protein PilW
MLERSRRAQRPRQRVGFSLVEVVVSMTILFIVLTVSTGLLRSQNALVAGQMSREDAEQNARFATTTIERELRMAGAGVVDGQPTLVVAGSTSVVFNADLVSRTMGDVGSVDVDTSVDESAASVFQKVNSYVLPGTAFAYPETTYTNGAGVPSSAETISYYLAADSSTGAGEYALYRRVNAAPPEVMARGILHTAADTLFQYFTSDTLGNVTPVAATKLPLVHTVAIDGATADTGKVALVDSIVAVRLKFRVNVHDRHGGTTTREAAVMIRILNAGMPHATTCGDPPLGITPTAVASDPADSVPHATITWPASLDEAAGEKSVERYMLFRRPSSATAFTESFASVPAGLTTYSYVDANVQSGDSWVYGVAAQDCTPTNSAIGVTGAVIIP